MYVGATLLSPIDYADIDILTLPWQTLLEEVMFEIRETLTWVTAKAATH